ncbi:hydrophobin, partial [Suillus ampliporus]
QCQTGKIQCCESSSSVRDKYNAAHKIIDLVPIDVDVTGEVGLNCSLVAVIGTGSDCAANQEPLCSSNNKWNGLVNVGCS